MDSNRNQVPIGVIGDLYIAGAGLAKGYLNNPEKTHESFVKNPFDITHGNLMYKTGDLAMITLSGDVIYYGREDLQVSLKTEIHPIYLFFNT